MWLQSERGGGGGARSSSCRQYNYRIQAVVIECRKKQTGGSREVRGNHRPKQHGQIKNEMFQKVKSTKNLGFIYSLFNISIQDTQLS